MRACFFLLLFSINTILGQAKTFKILVAPAVNRNSGSYNFQENNGGIETKRSCLNEGFVAQAYYYISGKHKLFISTGVRYIISESRFNPDNSVPGLFPPAIRWHSKVEQFSVPLHFGKTFIPFKKYNFYVDVFAGMSLGYIATIASFTEVLVEKSGKDDEMVGAGTNATNADDMSRKFLPTVDFGINFSPIPQWPRLSLGFLLSHNLESSVPVQRAGFISNSTRRIAKDYYFKADRNFTNFVCSVNYSFGRKWRNKVRAHDDF